MAGEGERTRSHVPPSTTPKTVRHMLARRKTEVCEIDLRTVLARQDVLRLEIAVSDAGVMARLHRVYERDERGAKEIVVVHVRLLADPFEHVSPRVVVEHDEQILVVLVRILEAHDVLVVGDNGVECDLAADERDLVGLPTDLGDDFDGEVGGLLGRAGVEVSGLVDDAEGARTDELEK